MALLTVVAPPRPRARLLASRREATATQVGFLTAAVLVGGTLLSIATTPDPLWWQLHFSRLGTFHVFSGYAFNATLIATGAGVVMFAGRLRAEMVRHAGTAVLTSRRSATVVPILVTLVGIHLSFVGVIPQNTNEFLHDRASTGAVFSFTVILLSSRWMLRGMHRAVARASRRVGLGLVVAVATYIAGFINLAAFELIGFGLIFFWLLHFAKCVGRPAEPSSSRPVRSSISPTAERTVIVTPPVPHGHAAALSHGSLLPGAALRPAPRPRRHVRAARRRPERSGATRQLDPEQARTLHPTTVRH